MNAILWVGEADFWPKRPVPDEPVFAMPLCEEAVLETAFDAKYAGLRRLSKRAALCCVSRFHQRTALPKDLSPEWAPIYRWPTRTVVKAPASCLASGVRVFEADFYTNELLRYAPHANIGVMEEFVDGPQWELDGYVVGGEFHGFRQLLQHWCDGRITHYEPSFASGLEETARRAVSSVGLDDCAFCIEARLSADGWKVIELHARLGEDKGLSDIMWETDPLDAIERFASEDASSRRMHVSHDSSRRHAAQQPISEPGHWLCRRSGTT